jgi:hypothetical protein
MVVCDGADREAARNGDMTLPSFDSGERLLLKLLGLQEAVKTIPRDLLMPLANSNGFERWRIDEITTCLGI